MSRDRTTTSLRFALPAALLTMALAAGCARSGSMDDGVTPDPQPSADSIPSPRDTVPAHAFGID